MSCVTSHEVSESSGGTQDEGAISRELGGMTGLYNLGNTCFLNSTLQCLLAADELSFALAELYGEGALRRNGGERSAFVESLGQLFHRMWRAPVPQSASYGASSVEPRHFKTCLGRVDARFAGYHQEDSQEALAIILDRLHEDLKRLRLPAVSGSEERDRADGWSDYCRREESLVRRLFHGQLRSTLTCPQCGFQSRTHDAFCFLNLPFPAERERQSAGPFSLLCFNDRFFGAESAFLVVRRSFASQRECASFFRGTGFWIVELEGSVVRDVKTRLPLPEALSAGSATSFVAFSADLTVRSFLVSFHVAGRAGAVGFPVLIKADLAAGDVLSAGAFLEYFFQRLLLPIMQHRFPSSVRVLRETLEVMRADPEAFFRLQRLQTLPDLTIMAVDILEDAAGLNVQLFGDDPDDFFDILVLDVESTGSDDSTTMSTVTAKTAGARSRHVPSCALRDCFLAFLAAERLESGESWHCERCKRAVLATKKLDLWRLPSLLILHLKRFSYGGTAGGIYVSSFAGAKITTRLDFPCDELDLAEFLVPGAPSTGAAQYELFAVSQHFGSLHCGHYTAVVRHRGTKRWMEADDCAVTMLAGLVPDDQMEAAAYVLFYRRKWQ